MQLSTEPPLIILFDGVCNLCDASVNFIIERDPKGVFRFASMQSAPGRELLVRHGIAADGINSLVLIEEGQVYMRSTGALRVARRLTFPARLLAAGVVIPRPLRDLIYDWIAANRYRWFGKRESCRMPTPELLSRFLPFGDREAVHSVD